MASVTAQGLRASARDAMLLAGGRGFMRFLPEGGALLVTDALRRCADGAAAKRLTDALEAAGFVCSEEEGMLLLTPCDALLLGLRAEPDEIDWRSPLHPVMALGARWCAHAGRPLGAAGRQLILEALRLTWQPEEKVLAGLAQLRARAAVMMRNGETDGLHEAGCALIAYCKKGEGGAGHEA